MTPPGTEGPPAGSTPRAGSPVPSGSTTHPATTLAGATTLGGAATLAAGQAAGFLIGMAGSALLARMLGPESRGTFELLVLYPNLAVLLFRGGAVTGAIYHAGSDAAARLRLAAQALGLTVLLGILGSLTGIMLAAAAPSLPVPRSCLVWAFAVFTYFLWISNARELLNGLGRFRANAVSIVFERGFLTLALAGSFLAGWTSLDLLFGLYLVGIVAVAALLWIQLGIPPRLEVGEDARRCLGYGLRSALAPILLFLHMRLDQMVLGGAGAARDLGFYVIAVTVSEVFLPLPDAIYSALYPRLMRAGAEKRELAARASRLSHSALAFIAVGVALAAGPVIRLLFGAVYLPALAFVPYLVAARFLQSGSNVLRASILADGRPLRVSAIAGTGLAVNAVALLLLVPAHGAHGAALASLCSAAVEYVLTLTSAAGGLGTSPLNLVIPRSSDAASLKR